MVSRRRSQSSDERSRSLVRFKVQASRSDSQTSSKAQCGLQAARGLAFSQRPRQYSAFLKSAEVNTEPKESLNIPIFSQLQNWSAARLQLRLRGVSADEQDKRMTKRYHCLQQSAGCLPLTARPNRVLGSTG